MRRRKGRVFPWRRKTLGRCLTCLEVTDHWRRGVVEEEEVPGRCPMGERRKKTVQGFKYPWTWRSGHCPA
jgi:hypothetical protein